MFHTTGKGRIDINRKFLMSPNFAFYGTVKLEAKKPLLFFDGFTELRYNVTEQIPLTWIGFKAEINPLDIRIPLKAKVEDRINKPVFGGLMLTNDSSHVYSNFLTRWKQYSDNPVFSALPQARESLKVTKIEDLGKDKNKEEDVGADVKAEEDKPEADIKTDKPVDNPDPEVKANEQIPVAVQDTAAIALNMEGDIFIPKIDTISYLIFDKLSMRYKIASSEKLKDPNVVGNLYELHKTNGFAYSEGLMSLMPSLKTLRNIAAGTAIHNLNIDSVSFEVALGLDFIFPSKAMDILIDELDNASNLEAVDLTKPSIKKRFVELLGTENAAKTLENLSAGGYTVPKQLSRTFLFSDITLVWNTPSHSYRSVGKIGINNIQNQYVNKYLENAFIELSHTRRGDVVNIYLKVPGASDFFFSFTQNQMRAISTNTEFNEIIDLVKPKDRRFKTNFGYYSYILSSDMLKARFLRQFIKMEEQTIDNVTDPNEGQQIEEPTHGND
jgi:hypothetical protein